jgi:hypothetical protein
MNTHRSHGSGTGWSRWANLTSRAVVTRRGIQITLGVIWLIDGILQFQTYMYSHAFVHDVLAGAAAGQPGVVGEPIKALAAFYGHDQPLWNTLAAEVQCLIGLGLIVSRRSVRTALLLSFGWSFMVWWFGEGLGPLVNGAPVSPLMGAPGAVMVYGLIGALVWPSAEARQPNAPPDGPESSGSGLLGRYGPHAVWTLLWLEAAVLWCVPIDRSPSAIHDQIASMAGGSPAWLAGALTAVADAAQGHGVLIATVLAIVSVVIALTVWTRMRWVALGLGITLSLAYWVFGQSLGGPFWSGSATDVNSGPLFALLALTVLVQPLPQHTASPAGAPRKAVGLWAR